MPIDPRTPRMTPASTENPNAALSTLASAVFVALSDLSRRIDSLESAKTVINDDVITGQKIAPGAIDTGEIAAGAIHTAQLEAGSILASIATIGAVNATHIDAGSIRASVLDASVLTAGNAFITNLRASILDAGILTASSAQIASLRASILDAGVLTATNAFITSLRASILDAGVLTATSAQIASLRASIINATQINSQGLSTEVLNAVKAAITDLSSVSTNTGTITAGLIRTGVSPNSRVELSSAGLKGYPSGVGASPVLSMDTATGIVSLTGIATLDPTSTIPGGALSSATLGGGNRLPNSAWNQGSKPGDATDYRFENWSNGSNSNGAGSGFTTDDAYYGSYSRRLIRTGTGASYVRRGDLAGSRLPVKPNRKYTISSWVKPETRAEDVRLYAYWFTGNTVAGVAGSEFISSINGVNVNGVPTTNAFTACPQGQWSRVTFTVTAPATATHVGIIPGYFNGTNSVTTAALDSNLIGAMQFEEGDAPTAYAPAPDEIIYGSIQSLYIGAGEIKASNLDVGAVTADKISLGVPTPVGIPNGQFNAGNPATGSALANGWTTSGNAATVQTDTSFGKVAQIVNGSLATSYFTQTITVPAGRHIIRGWVKSSATVSANGAGLVLVAGTATATLTNSVTMTGTFGYTLLEAVADVTTAGTITIRGQLGKLGTATGTVQFANFHIIPAVTGTTLTPTSIDAMTITGATFQTAAPGVARTVMDINGLRFNDGTADTVNLSAATNGLTLLAATTDLPPVSRKITYLHAAGGATAGEFFVLSNSSATPTFSNPSAATDLSGWTILVSGTASVVRDTSVYDSSPASFKFTGEPGSNARAYTTMTGTFKAGVTYRVPFSYRAASGVNPQVMITGDPVGGTLQYMNLNLTGAGAGLWVRTYIEWTPQVDVTSPSLYVTSPAGAAPVSNFDTFGPIELMTRTLLTASAKTGGIDSAGIAALTKRSDGTTATATLLNDNGESDFLRFTQLRTSKMNFGRKVVSWPGGSPFTSSQVVEHNLGVVPDNVQIIGIGGTTASFFVDSVSSTTITFRGREMTGASPAGGTTIDAFWMVVG